MLSVLSRCGPISLLASSFILMVGGLAATRLDSLAYVGTGLLVVVVVLCGNVLLVWKRLAVSAVAMVSIVWSNWLLASTQDGSQAIFAGVRVAFFVLPGIIFASFVDLRVLGDNLSQGLHLPARPVIAATAALQRFESLHQEWTMLRLSRHARGLGPSGSWASRARTVGSLAMSLLVSSMRNAGSMSVAMEARGFSRPRATKIPRTWAEPARWTWADSLLISLCIAASVAAIAIPI